MKKPTGRRKITLSMSRAMINAGRWGPKTAIDKARAVTAFNRGTKWLGLNAQAIELMNKLLSFSAPQDWAADSRPLVWPDNRRLLDELSFGAAALHRNMRRLCESGLITFRDSPKGQRFGRRDDRGRIVLEASFGIDLSALGVMTPALEAAFAAERRRSVEWRGLSRRFTCLRKMVASILDAGIEYDLQGPWSAAQRELREIVDLKGRRPTADRLASLCRRLTDLHAMVCDVYATAVEAIGGHSTEAEKAVEVAENDKKVRPMGSENESPIQNTNERKHIYWYSPASSGDEPWRSAEAPCPAPSFFRKKNAAESTIAHGADGPPIDPKTLLTLCPRVAELLCPREDQTWAGIIRAIESVVRRHLRISEDTWWAAVRTLGHARAASAVALIFEKHEVGLIGCPGAYLNGMTAKAKGGQLRLSSSLFHWSGKNTIHSHGKPVETAYRS